MADALDTTPKLFNICRGDPIRRSHFYPFAEKKWFQSGLLGEFRMLLAKFLHHPDQVGA